MKMEVVIVTLFALALPAGCAVQKGAKRPGPPVGFDLQGHRGARGLLPENTLPAFRRALELGVTTLEMDVVISGDSQVVVSHEPWFSSEICSLPSGEPVPPEAEKTYALFAMTYDEIAQFDCGRRGHPDFPRQQPTPAGKPLLRTVIAEAERYARRLERPPVQYSIETKSRPEWEGTLHPDPETFVRLLYDVLTEAGVTERSIVQSFDPRTLRAMRRLDASVRLALLVERGPASEVKQNVEALGFVPAIYSPDYRAVDAALVEAAHALGMRVIPWTVNTPSAMQRLKRLGVDGLITDYPNVAQALPEQ